MAEVNPGTHPSVEIHRLSRQEEAIVTRIAQEQYVTRVSEIEVATNSRYRYLLFKPTDSFAQMFNLEREIALVMAPFQEFQPRALEAFPRIIDKEVRYRVEPLCAVLVSAFPDIENAVSDLISNDPEAQIVVPFTYVELLSNNDSYFIRNRFISRLFSRDLFSISGPLKKEMFFYGRSELVNSIASRHKANENAGLFGLRRTGKTSVAFGVQRQVQRDGGYVGFVDCQSPAFNQQRWYGALRYVSSVVLRESGDHDPLSTLPEFHPTNAGQVFEDTMRSVRKRTKKKFLLIFDEIENITFRVSPVEHWENGLDFIFFWQAIRSVYQTTDSFTFLIVGTNPTCVEIPSVNGKDNPIFNQIPFEFIPGFTVKQTRQMVRRLGRIMGLRFRETLYGTLTEDFGGHPFLIRQVCSAIHGIVDKKRPIDVDRSTYDVAIEKFNADSSRYISMILDILLNFYKDEYEMLRVLASEDFDYFDQLADSSPDYVRHLIGYGIIEQGTHRFLFKIKIIKDYLNAKENYENLVVDDAARLAEISKRRNKIEPALRRLVKQSLKSHKGVRKASEIVVEVMTPSDKKAVSTLSYNDLFDPSKSKIYFRYLVRIIENHWGAFQHVFSDEKYTVVRRLDQINELRKDAHAGIVSSEEFGLAMHSFAAIERDLGDFF